VVVDLRRDRRRRAVIVVVIVANESSVESGFGTDVVEKRVRTRIVGEDEQGAAVVDERAGVRRRYRFESLVYRVVSVRGGDGNRDRLLGVEAVVAVDAS
jgi:hypothetical protein